MSLTRSITLALAVSTLTLGSATLCRADDAPASAPAPNLEKTMGKMGKDFGAIMKQIKDKDQKESTLKLLGDLEGLVVVAKGINPPVQRVAEADRDHAAADFRNLLTTVLRGLLTAEELVAADKFDDAEAAFKEIGKTIGAGHKEFKVGKENK